MHCSLLRTDVSADGMCVASYNCAKAAATQLHSHGRVSSGTIFTASFACAVQQVFKGAMAEWQRDPDFGGILSVTEMKRIVSNFCQNNRNKTRMKQRAAARQQKQAAAEAAKEAADATALQRTARRMGRAPVTTCSGTMTDDTSSSDKEGQD